LVEELAFVASEIPFTPRARVLEWVHEDTIKTL
jgi:hypothetical protein